jgi:hypothetical protein
MVACGFWAAARAMFRAQERAPTPQSEDVDSESAASGSETDEDGAREGGEAGEKRPRRRRRRHESADDCSGGGTDEGSAPAPLPDEVHRSRGLFSSGGSDEQPGPPPALQDDEATWEAVVPSVVDEPTATTAQRRGTSSDPPEPENASAGWLQEGSESRCVCVCVEVCRGVCLLVLL